MDSDRPTVDLLPDVPTRMLLIERSILLLLVVGLFVSVVAILRPFMTPILFGGALAIAAWPLRQFLVRHGMGRGLAALLLLFLSMVVVLVPAVAVAPHITDQLGQATQRFERFFHPRQKCRPGSVMCP